MSDESFGTLKLGEFHPAAHIAAQYLKETLKSTRVGIIVESIASSALSGNRLAEVSHETLRRYLAGEPVSDRYLMGLAWLIWQLNQKEIK